MADSKIKSSIAAAVKDAMRARDKQRLGVLRLIMSEFKKVEVDERIDLEDDRVIAILDKMGKQRKDSFTQFKAAGRDDLADQEAFEVELLKEFLPAALDDASIDQLIDQAITATSATSMKQMGQLMAILKPQLQGRADMALVSKKVKQKLL
ncbi:MAG: GatB/YqeY domain-containing protein [Pseudomonadales bacterium]|nr:GatB/YqeY domain-containing protein [Pseudomonadales bacterium]